MGYQNVLQKIDKGIYDSGQLLVQLGLVIATALSVTLLLSLTWYLSTNRHEQFLKTTKIYLRLTMVLSLADSVDLAMLVPYINCLYSKIMQGILLWYYLFFQLG